MRIQIETAQRMGLRAAAINANNVADWIEVEAQLARNEIDIRSSQQGLSVPEILGQVNLSKGRVTKTIDLLALESPAPIAQDGSKWQLAAADLSEAFWQRAERLTTLRRTEQQQMADYVKLPFGQHMSFLVQALDGNVSAVRPPGLPALPITVNPALAQAAVAFLRRTSLPIEPRKLWPSYGLPQFQVKGRIAPQHQAQPGKVLCVWGDAGWGGLVRQGKYQQRRFADELVAACASMVAQWQPQPAPTWVTCVPSLRHPDLVPNFAQRLATALGLPFHTVLAKTDHRPEQKTMTNSTQQARNVDGSLALCVHRLPRRGPVLLVDDMVDSRWTLTVCAWLLRRSGSGEVWPLALSLAGQEEDPT